MMVVLVLGLLALLATATAWAFTAMARRLRRATQLVNTHERFQHQLLADAVRHADLDPFAQTTLDHLRQHTNQTSKMKGLT